MMSIGPRGAGAGDLAPFAVLAGEDRLDLRFGEVGEGVGLVGDDADRVLGDRVEDEPGGIGGQRVARDVADRDAPGGDVVDADLGAALGDPEADLVVQELDVLVREQLYERVGGGGSADRDHARSRGDRGHRAPDQGHSRERGDQYGEEGLGSPAFGRLRHPLDGGFDAWWWASVFHELTIS